MTDEEGTPRGETHHPAPPTDLADLDRFPARTLDGSWYRAHVARGGHDRGCWWFSSVTGKPEDAGRFDLPRPGGTCYFATTEESAARERVGTLLRRSAGREVVTVAATSTQDGPVVVTQVNIDRTRAANLPVKAAQRWVDRSMSSGTGVYAITQAWAAAFHAAGLEGIVYAPRFTLGAQVRALAVFGKHGRPTRIHGITGSRPLEDVLEQHGVRVIATPGTPPAVLPPAASPPAL